MRFHLPLFAALVVAASSPAPAASDAKTATGSVRYLYGTWDCKHTVGSFAGTYVTKYANGVSDRWIRQTYDFAAADGKPAWKGEFVMGYVPARQAWVRFGMLSTGEYFAIRMTDTQPAGSWNWKYVTFFKRQKPESPGPDATLIKKSDTSYEITGPTYAQNGKTVTEHHVCTKR